MRTREDVGTLDDIAAAAVRSAGLDDFGDDLHVEGLALLLDDLAAHADLTPRGNFLQRAQIKSSLVGKLMLQNGFRQYPQAADVTIKRPLFVTGLPRTGTTALHRLLDADPHHQGLELWLTELPQPRPPRDTWADNPIFVALEQAYSPEHSDRPDLKGVHHIAAAEVEECWRLLRHQGLSLSYPSLANVPNYLDYAVNADWTEAYRQHRRGLQLIGLNDQDKRWVLKNPSHLIGLDAIMAVYPDALIVRTHRDPAKSVPSACSLSERATAGWSESFVGEQLAAFQVKMLAAEEARFRKERAAYDASQFVDVAYDDFVADPAGVVAGIYSSFDLPWTDEVESVVRAADESSRSDDQRKPSHSYSLGDYGLDEAEVRKAFS